MFSRIQEDTVNFSTLKMFKLELLFIEDGLQEATGIEQTTEFHRAIIFHSKAVITVTTELTPIIRRLEFPQYADDKVST